MILVASSRLSGRAAVSAGLVCRGAGGSVRAVEVALVAQCVELSDLFPAQLLIQRGTDDASGVGQPPGDVPVGNEFADGAVVGGSGRLAGSESIEGNHELVQVLQDSNSLAERHADLAGGHVHRPIQLHSWRGPAQIVILLAGAGAGMGAATADHRRVKTNDHAVAAGHSVDPARWQEAFEGLMGRIAGRFARVEPRRRVRLLVLGLLSGLPRKNCWTIAEWAGEATPDGMQHLLGRAKWDADLVRDEVRDYVVEHLHDDEAVLVVDETGDVKKGRHTVGVQRQYTGTAGRIENSQVAVYLVYAGRRGHAAVDRELYVPRSWTSEPARCRIAGLDQDTVFATKPELAARMIGRFLDAGRRAPWVAGDEVYGGNPKLRAALEKQGCGYVLAVARTHEVPTRAGKFRADALASRSSPQGPARRGTASTTGLSSTSPTPAPAATSC